MLGAAIVMRMPTVATGFGRSLKITKPRIVAKGISRYCMGASVADGA
jgi:hypothetical protein